MQQKQATARPRALYTVDYHHTRFCSVIALADVHGDVSVTNDADAIVAAFASRRGIRGWQIVYRDSMGNWDELVHDGRTFKGFRALNAKTLEAALATLDARIVPAHPTDGEIRAARCVLATHGLVDEIARLAEPMSDRPPEQVRNQMRAVIEAVAACPLVDKSTSRRATSSSAVARA